MSMESKGAKSSFFTVGSKWKLSSVIKLRKGGG